MYIRHTKGYLFLLAMYIDDLVIASKSIEKIIELEGHLQKRFSIKPSGDIDYVLGLKIERNREHKKLKLSQETYARRILEQFGMTDCRPTACSLAPTATLEAHQGPAANFLYSQAIRSIMYLAMGTQPDLAFSVGLVSCFASNPGEVYVKIVKMILYYVRATIDIKLTFGKSSN